MTSSSSHKNAEGGVLDELDDPESGSGATVAGIDAALADPGASLAAHDAEVRAAALREVDLPAVTSALQRAATALSRRCTGDCPHHGQEEHDLLRGVTALLSRLDALAARTPAAEPERSAADKAARKDGGR